MQIQIHVYRRYSLLCIFFFFSLSPMGLLSDLILLVTRLVRYRIYLTPASIWVHPWSLFLFFFFFLFFLVFCDVIFALFVFFLCVVPNVACVYVLSILRFFLTLSYYVVFHKWLLFVLPHVTFISLQFYWKIYQLTFLSRL